MKLASYIHPTLLSKSYGIISNDGITDIGIRIGANLPDLKSAIKYNKLSYIREFEKHTPDFNINDVTFIPVIDNPRKIICVGMNYQQKRVEFDEKCAAPTLFIRFPDTLTGHGSSLLKPVSSDEFDYEGELAVIIGKSAKSINRKDALDYVAGYSCFMDGSVRDMQYSWFTSGKNWANTGGFGPWMVTSDEIPDPQCLSIQTYLNGIEVQRDSTSNMLRTVAEIVEYISSFTQLSPGDVIITGSPGGVGKMKNPPLFMQHGDIVEVEISGIGKLRNIVSAAN